MLGFSKQKEVDTDEKKIDEVLTRGVNEVIQKEELKKELLSGRQLRVKLGIDPTSTNLHLGNAIALLKLRDFQELGHIVVFIIGDATGIIGDTSDKDSERPMLSREQVKENSKTYFEQAGRILDMSKAEKLFNSEWLNRLTYKDIGEHADQFSVADFVARENIRMRLEKGTRVSLREILYPLMQGYDSVAINADVELGGTDQRFNLLAGRKLQEHFGKRPQHILMTEMIDGTDGRQMSKSLGNTINILDEPDDMYGKIMSLHDELVEQYFISCTRVPMLEVETLMSEKHPRDAKMQLAREIVSLYHGKEKAAQAEENFVSTFTRGEIPSEIPEVAVLKGTRLFDAMSSLVSSKSELRRLILEGAVEYEDGRKVPSLDTVISEGTVLKIGKRRFIRIVVED